MQPVSLGATRYDTTTITFHWLTAILVAEQWLGAQVIDWFPRGAPRIDARSVHIVCGALLAVILLGRIVWRLTEGRRLPLADRGFLNLVARATHIGLYVLIAAMVGIGMVLTWARGDTLFNLVTIPALRPGDHTLADQVQGIHALIGWLIVGIATLHAGGALVHRFLWHDAVLGRMLLRAPD